MRNKASEKSQSAKGSSIDDVSTAEVLGLVKSLHKYSKDSWTSREEALWKKYIVMLWDEELEALKSRGQDDEKAEKLVELVWASRNSESSALMVDRLPPNSSSSFVPALRVFRHGSFVIHPDVQPHLDCHPYLAVPGGDTMGDGDDRPLILQAIDAVEESLGLGYIGLGYVCPSMPADAGQNGRSADCADAVHQLRVLLDTEYLKGTPNEDLGWLEAAKNRDRFWRLLDTAFLFGEFMEHQRLLDELGAEEAMVRRITMPPGKGARIERAIVKMIEAYVFENNIQPKPGKLLKWLGGEKPHESGKPLQVNHPFWTVDMKPITWAQFQNGVKKAKQKMGRSADRADDANSV